MDDYVNFCAEVIKLSGTYGDKIVTIFLKSPKHYYWKVINSNQIIKEIRIEINGSS